MSFRSRVDAELREGLDILPVLKLPDDLDEVRKFSPLPREKASDVRETDLYIQGAGGQNMLLKRFEPVEQTPGELLPAVLWIHGGGYILGHPEAEGALCEQFVQKAGCIVFAPDYRLAPEHPYPAPLEDCYAALSHMANEAESLGIDASRIAIGGGSAGGGLAAALALLARDRGGPSICFQMPLYPMLDDRNEAPSTYEEMDPAVWNRENNQAAWRMYLGEHGEGSPYAAPGRAVDLKGLPPAYLCVGQMDLFRDETISYAARLAQADVDVELHVHPGCYHASELFIPDAAISRRVRLEYVAAMARALGKSGTTGGGDAQERHTSTSASAAMSQTISASTSAGTDNNQN
ncbi:alpha/beta hydrolase [Paenibacillus oryzae]|uniref:alpha/beta hydrolase n=1 Tax=Paenibacillus oryzae TaxID=1844972 RepID=UPI0009EE6BAF|nr:alpha/beta hydrolase [Paenibacillus oryzae]